MNYSLSAESRLGAAVILVNTPKGIEPDDEREKRATSARFKSRLGRFSERYKPSDASCRVAAPTCCNRQTEGFESGSDANGVSKATEVQIPSHPLVHVVHSREFLSSPHAVR